MDDIVNERLKGYVQNIVDRLRESFRNARVEPTRCAHLSIVCKDLIAKIIEWFNENMKLKNLGCDEITEAEVYRFMAIILYSQTSGFSLEHVTQIFQQCGRKVLQITRLRFILSNLRAFHPSLDYEVGQDENLFQRTKSCQRDKTRFLIEMERCAFGISRRLFYIPNHQTLTVDEELYGSRVHNKSISILSDRESVGEDLSADVVSDASFRICLCVRFNRQGEQKVESFKRLLDDMNEYHGEMTRRSCIITIDRDFGKLDFSVATREKGYNFIFVTPDYPMFGHPSIGLSYLKARREEIVAQVQADSEIDAIGHKCSREADRGQQGDCYDVRSATNDFIIDHHLGEDWTCYVVVDTTERQQQLITRRAIAIREQTRGPSNKIIRFMVDLPTVMVSHLNCWGSSYRGGDLSNDITAELAEDNSSNDYALQSETKRVLNTTCRLLTRGQQCADWFVLRRFRLTATVASMVLLRNQTVRQQLLGKPDDVVQLSKEIAIAKLHDSWFSTKQDSEMMRRDTVNEEACLSSLRDLDFVRKIYDCGLLEHRRKPYHAASPDGIALISQSFLQEETGWDCSLMCNTDGVSCSIASVQITTVAATNTVAASSRMLPASPVLKEIDDESILKKVDNGHLLQMAYQCYVMNTNLCLYALCSEAGVHYLALLYISPRILKMVESALDNISADCLAWAHLENPFVPAFAPESIARKFSSYLPFWGIVNKQVLQAPLLPVRYFRHGMQLFFSKTKGEVDGLTQYRASMSNLSSHLKWEQSALIEVLKTLVVNAFVSYRIYESSRGGLNFHSIGQFRHELNKLDSFPDFIATATEEILEYASRLDVKDIPSTEDAVVNNIGQGQSFTTETGQLSNATAHQLRIEAQGQKRRRLNFFNSEPGINLRFQTGTHPPIRMAKALWCALCGSSTSSNIGRKTRTRCRQCHTPLCLVPRHGYTESCFNHWHSTRALVSRGRVPKGNQEGDANISTQAQPNNDEEPNNDADS